MKSAVLNVSINTDTPEGEKLRDMILSNDFKNGWLVVSWIDRTKYNPVELLKQSEDAKRIAIIEAIRLNSEIGKMRAWIEKARDLIIYHDLHSPEFQYSIDAKQFETLIDEAPI